MSFFKMVKALNAIYFSLRTIFPIGYSITSFLFMFSVQFVISSLISLRSMIFNCIFNLLVKSFLIFKSIVSIPLVFYHCVTNYLTLRSLQENPFIILQFQWVRSGYSAQVSTRPKSRCWQSCSPCWRLQGGSTSRFI